MNTNVCIRLEADEHQIQRCKEQIDTHLLSFEAFGDLLSLAGNSVRLKILYLLFTEEKLCVCDLSDVLQMNISAISQHLRKLKDRDYILSERQAQVIYYRINERYLEVLKPIFMMIESKVLPTAV